MPNSPLPWEIESKKIWLKQPKAASALDFSYFQRVSKLVTHDIKTTGFVRNWWFFFGGCCTGFIGGFRGEKRAWGGCRALRFCVCALNYKMRCAVCRLDDAGRGRCSQKVFPFLSFPDGIFTENMVSYYLEYNQREAISLWNWIKRIASASCC